VCVRSGGGGGGSYGSGGGGGFARAHQGAQHNQDRHWVMSANIGGVHVILKKTFPHAVYVHCNSHRLNLGLCTAAKVSPGISTFFDIINSLHNFMTGVHRHAKFLEIQKQMRPGQKTLELERSCDVRWSSWSNAVSKVLTLLGLILETLATFSESYAQTKLEADSLLHQMQTKKFLFLFVTFNQLFEVSDYATKGLQSSTLSVTDCIDLIEGLKDSTHNSGMKMMHLIK